LGVGELLRRLDQALLPSISQALVWCLRGQVRRRVVLVGGVLGTTALLVASVWAARLPPSPHGDPGVVRVGVSEGQPVSSYAADSDRELDQLPGTGASSVYALVSFSAYLAPDRFARRLGAISLHRAYAHVPFPGIRTDVVEITIHRTPGDLRTGMIENARDKTAEARSYQADAQKLTGSSTAERDRRDSYRAKAAAATAEAEAYRSMCSCLYAAVVRGTPGQLHRLAAVAGVRTVDPAPELTDLQHAVFTPPLPEYPDISGPSPSESPPTTPSETPSGSPTGTPSPSSPLPSPSTSPSDSATGTPTGSGYPG